MIPYSRVYLSSVGFTYLPQVSPTAVGFTYLPQVSPAAVGFTYLPQVSPGVIQGLTRGGGSFRENGINYAGPARRVQPMNNHGCNPWKRTTYGGQDPPRGVQQKKSIS